MKRVFLLTLLIFISSNTFSQQLSFYREDITMKIENESFYVSGTYYFHYDLKDKKLLYYPFPIDEMYGNPDSIYVFDLTNNLEVEPLELDSSKFLFLVDFRYSNNVAIQISYKQILNSNKAEYILNTTQVWRKPFNEATYQLIVPSNIEIQSFSILPSDSIVTKFDKVYTWRKYNYMPEQNMIFEFSKLDIN